MLAAAAPMLVCPTLASEPIAREGFDNKDGAALNRKKPAPVRTNSNSG